ncbi:MAG: elongation factor 4 [Deltaproteobacteria bacterium CG11_big_fil_rev_8_21_14_0_20_47_16]|nr:MAG: elongation factor 4 [Deltaproteobacteria bacterium CG11_big_fil_rev_8_21_14_0_20_47_16]
MNPENIRNFCIIAHIDHGKSTLADRLMGLTGALTKREEQEQFLDKMDIERERGITIKAQSVRLNYKAKDGKTYQLNLIDTPGHVDFHYEVSRSLAACEGALLVVDSTQGIQAQTLANALAAIEANLTIIPIINKIDLPNADVERVALLVHDTFGFDPDDAIPVSAKTGIGVDQVLEAIVSKLPPPTGDAKAPLQALIFDSWFDPYQGVVGLVRVVQGTLKVGMRIRLIHTGREYELLKLNVSTPRTENVQTLTAGEVGVVVAGVKELKDLQIGDTITDADAPSDVPLPGFKKTQQIVFAGVFPIDATQYENLRTALAKLQLNDASFSFEPETSLALGFGFRCGFLGSLHMEIIQERLEREYDLDLITTAPTVVYQILLTDGSVMSISNPSEFPDVGRIEEITEPYAKVSVHTPTEFLGNIIKLCQERRGIQTHMEYFGEERVQIKYDMPLAELIFDFHDKLKSGSKGYASIDYEVSDYRPGDLVKMDMLVNGDPVDALSVIVHRDQAYGRGREIAESLKGLLPRQQFIIAIQAAIGGKIVARETVSALRKNVTAKCYGGDITRKRKLLEKQKEGKKRMKQVGSVEIPQEAFLSVLRVK